MQYSAIYPPDKTKTSHRKILAAAAKQGLNVTEIWYDNDPDRGGWTVIVSKDGCYWNLGAANLERTLSWIKEFKEELYKWMYTK